MMDARENANLASKEKKRLEKKAELAAPDPEGLDAEEGGEEEAAADGEGDDRCVEDVE